MKYYIIFGPPGAGKGTQSSLVAKKYNFIHLSTGQLLRDEIAKGTKIGVIAKGVIDKGRFVEDSLIMELIDHQIHNSPKGTKGFIFDGFPRTLAQARFFDEMLEKIPDAEVNAVFSLEVSEAMIIDRIKKRSQIEKRKDDSSIETVKRRIEAYHAKTEPLIAYYKERGKYFSIKGGEGIEEIFDKICHLIDNS